MKWVFALIIVFCLSLVMGSHSMVLAQTATSNSSANSNQTQVQNQGQSQSSTQSSNQSTSFSNAGQASITTGSSTSTNVNPRNFPIPGSANFAYIPSYFGPATADVNWQSMKTMSKYKLDWTTSDAITLLKGGKLKSRPKCFYGIMSEEPVGGVIRVAVNGDGAKEIKEMTMIGSNDIWAKNVDTTTQEVLGQAIMDGLKMRADVCLVTGEGAAVVLKAFGWGVGLSNSVSVVTGTTGNVGNVSAGGIGVSGVEAGYRSKPWLQVLYFKKL